MRFNLVLNMADQGFSMAGYDKDPNQVEPLRKESAGRNICGTEDINDFVVPGPWELGRSRNGSVSYPPDVKGTTTGATIAGFAIPLAGRKNPGAQLTVTTVAVDAVARAKFMCRLEISPNTSVLLQEPTVVMVPIATPCRGRTRSLFRRPQQPIRPYRQPGAGPQRVGRYPLLSHPANRLIRRVQV